jgi:hypothetical protein
MRRIVEISLLMVPAIICIEVVLQLVCRAALLLL